MHNDAVDFHEAAGIEYDEAFEWYLQRSPETALRFATEVDNALTQILRAPDRWAKVHLKPADFCSVSFLSC